MRWSQNEVSPTAAKLPAAGSRNTNHLPLPHHRSHEPQWWATVVTCTNANRGVRNVKCDTITRRDHQKNGGFSRFPFLPGKKCLPCYKGLVLVGKVVLSRSLALARTSVGHLGAPRQRAQQSFTSSEGQVCGLRKARTSCSEVTHRVLIHNEPRRPKTGR